MKANKEFVETLEILLNDYKKELDGIRDSNIIKKKTHKTYLLHSTNFVRWVKDEFEPGARNK